MSIDIYRTRLRERLYLPRLGAALLTTGLLAGCSIDISATASNAEAIIEADFEGQCSGNGVEETDFGTVNYSKDDASGRCAVLLDWAGDLADMGPVKQSIDNDADGADVTLEEINVRLKLVDVQNAAGQSVPIPTLESFQGSVSVAGVPLYALDGTSIDALVGPDGISVSFSGEGDPVVQAVNAALDAGGSLPATAQVSLTTTSTLPLQTGNPHRFVFRHDIELKASASASIF